MNSVQQFEQSAKEKLGHEVDSRSTYSKTSSSEPSVEDLEEELVVYTEYRLNKSPIRWFWQFSLFIDKLAETRTVGRQSPTKRTKTTYWALLKLFAIWWGGSLSIPSMTGFFLGPLMFNLSFRASVSAGLFGSFFGTVMAAFGAVMGPRSGLRQMMGVRYQFGWWFSKFMALLTCCTGLGWLIVNGNFGGQMLSSLTDGRVSIQIGILIVFLVVLVLSVLGIKLIAYFDSFFIIPLFVAFLLCYICTGHEFQLTAHSKVEGVYLTAGWVSFFQNCIGITSTWLPVASDYHLDMPESTNRICLFFFVLFAIFIPTAFAGILGCGLASAALFDPRLSALYSKYGGAGLIVDGMRRWHGGGTFIVVLLYISLITNSVLTVYSFGLAVQSMGKPLARTPRYIWVILGSIIWYVLAAVGQSGWSETISNFMPMIGYWSMIYAIIFILESYWFRRKPENEYDWSQYLNRKHFPIMWAAMIAFGCGVAGVVVGMDQYYYVGRLARTIGKGCELGTLLAFGFAGVTYVPLRYLELYLRRGSPIRP